MPGHASNYEVLPLPVVQKTAKKILTTAQLRAAIREARALRFYPNVPDLDIKPCGEGMELVVEDPAIGKQGWLRAMFWVDEKAKTIYVVDLFWKKTNAVSTADKLRADDRVRRLKAELKKGQKPWG
jgi:phage-related protein